MRIFAQDAYIAADFAARKLTVIARAPTEDGLPPGQQPVPGIAGFGIEEVSWDEHDALASEHAAFEASVLDGAPVLVDAVVGRRALEAALAVAESMRTSRAQMIASGLITRQ
jgi:predicted dehydrogenase